MLSGGCLLNQDTAGPCQETLEGYIKLMSKDEISKENHRLDDLFHKTFDLIECQTYRLSINFEYLMC